MNSLQEALFLIKNKLRSFSLLKSLKIKKKLSILKAISNMLILLT